MVPWVAAPALAGSAASTAARMMYRMIVSARCAEGGAVPVERRRAERVPFPHHPPAGRASAGSCGPARGVLARRDALGGLRNGVAEVRLRLMNRAATTSGGEGEAEPMSSTR